MRDRYVLEKALVALIGLAIATLMASRFLTSGPAANVVVLGVAVLKGRRILVDFLGLRTAPAVWRGLVTAWVIVVASFAGLASIARLLV